MMTLHFDELKKVEALNHDLFCFNENEQVLVITFGKYSHDAVSRESVLRGARRGLLMRPNTQIVSEYASSDSRYYFQLGRSQNG